MTKQRTYQSKLLDQIIDSISPEEQQKTDKKMILAAKIANAIKVKGLNKSEFAELMGKHPSEISKWLSGTHNFTVDTLMTIEAGLGISIIATDYFKINEEYQSVQIRIQNALSPSLKNSIVNKDSRYDKDAQKDYRYRLTG
ncbi:MAG: helix-turn-helix transcriptional regulator [Balneola sp.]|nr:helix-turn-helix transcriptional regulator [Balneola sp.]MBO6649471.1 helix-turn-helix transcriptional regulator [Balneola sp.]MBO6711286.1 helix-turn-helix transcriptional regulator [Balneola sp.]MBO6800599.1 helix-turn-helix transcriptional regulator [Balneola sp.]MBO6869222.1 helix-turn-helix transcriptional regulator [Balneola sp.]